MMLPAGAEHYSGGMLLTDRHRGRRVVLVGARRELPQPDSWAQIAARTRALTPVAVSALDGASPSPASPVPAKAAQGGCSKAGGCVTALSTLQTGHRARVLKCGFVGLK